MENIKHDGAYVKSLCAMIARGDISDIGKLEEYLEYVNFDSWIDIKYLELEMLCGVEIDKMDPKNYGHGRLEKYKPIDLILYSMVSNNWSYTYRRILFEQMLKVEDIDFSCIPKTLVYIVSKGKLDAFKLVNSVCIDYNYPMYKLNNGEPYSILDNCLSLALARLTINGKDEAEKYPREILDYFLSLSEEAVDFSLLKSTIVILKCLEKNEGSVEISNSKELFSIIENTVNNYEHTY